MIPILLFAPKWSSTCVSQLNKLSLQQYGSDVDFLDVQSDSIETDRVCDIPRFLAFTRSRIRVDPTVSCDLIVAYHP